jgi:hypothetical protein
MARPSISRSALKVSQCPGNDLKQQCEFGFPALVTELASTHPACVHDVIMLCRQTFFLCSETEQQAQKLDTLGVINFLLAPSGRLFFELTLRVFWTRRRNRELR